MNEATPLRAPAAARSHRAEDVERLTRRLVDYFVALSAAKSHVFELRDINLQVMANVFAPKERALLDVAIEGLIQDGVLHRVSATGYSLTDEGVGRVTQLRSHRDVGATSADHLAPRKDAGLHGVGEALPASGPAAKPNV